jgi:ABC-type transport system substrate-binding protein
MFTKSISKLTSFIILTIIVVAAIGSVATYYSLISENTRTTLVTSSSSESSLSTVLSPSTSKSSETNVSIPSSLTWETPNTVDYLDPQVSYTAYSYSILQNIYEPLLWYNGSCSSCIIPWLAQSYSVSSDLKTYNFTLRAGIKFADGEALNSTAVYFSLNRLLMEDGSTPESHGTQASFILQQLLNSNLSTTLCGCAQAYNSTYVDEVQSEGFVTVTGPLSFTIKVQNPSEAFPYMLGDIGSDIVAPQFVMQNDLSLWNQSSSGYHLPYPSLSGNESQMIDEYFLDEVATCNGGATPKGCGETYLDASAQGSLAGTGPYTLKSFDDSTNDIVLQSNPNYWGGPNQSAEKIRPQIRTININYVADQQTRLLDLRSAAGAGEAYTVDVEPDNLYSVANRTLWLSNNTLSSILPGVDLYGPYKSFYTYFDAYSINVTNPQTGEYYQFQPFADERFRLAFADSVNLSEINEQENNEMGEIASNVVPPGLPPSSSFNASISPIYSYNLTAVQDLLLDAMLHPVNSFTFVNGSRAPPGTFDNTFGCSALDSQGKCSKPVQQTITLTYYTGDTVDQSIFENIAYVVNNISSTFNMGLTVAVTPEPFGFMSTEGFSDELYMYMIGGWGDDYPWVTDFLGPMYAPGQIYPASDGWNLTQMGTLYQQAASASASGNDSALVTASNAMNMLANEEVMYLWTFYPYSFTVMTSNVHGFYFNPSLAQEPTGFYFAALY